MTDDDIRDRLTERLADWHGLNAHACLNPVQRDAVADALLPVVRGLIADHIDNAADDWDAAEPGHPLYCEPGVEWLRDRAAALRDQP
jgi:hypothetical protein